MRSRDSSTYGASEIRCPRRPRQADSQDVARRRHRRDGTQRPVTELLAPPIATVEIEHAARAPGVTSAAAAVAYFSFESPQSFVAARDPDGSITPLIGFFPLPVRGAQLLHAIALDRRERAAADRQLRARVPRADRRDPGVRRRAEHPWSRSRWVAARGVQPDARNEGRGCRPKCWAIPDAGQGGHGRGRAQRALPPRRQAAPRSVMSSRIADGAKPRAGPLGVRVAGRLRRQCRPAAAARLEGRRRRMRGRSVRAQPVDRGPRRKGLVRPMLQVYFPPLQ